MRNFNFLILLFSILTLAACADENKKTPSEALTNDSAETTSKSEAPTNTSAGIAGKWKADFWHIEGTFENGNFMANGTDMGKITVTFAEDGTFSSEGDKFTTKHTINVDGMEFSNENVNENPFHTGTWEKVGDILKIKNDGEPEVYEYRIDVLTSKRMEMSLDDYKFDDDEMEGDFKARMGYVR